MKTVLNEVMNFVKTAISIFTFGLISFNKSITKEYSIELLKVKLADLKFARKKQMDKYISICGEQSVMKSNIKEDERHISNIKKSLSSAHKENNVAKFNTLALELTSSEDVYKEHKNALASLDKAVEIMKLSIDSMAENIRTFEIKIKGLEAKKATYDVIKSVNDTLGSVGMQEEGEGVDTSNMSSEIENDIIRETTKADIIGTSKSFEKPVQYSTKSDMAAFLKEHSIK